MVHQVDVPFVAYVGYYLRRHHQQCLAASNGFAEVVAEDADHIRHLVVLGAHLYYQSFALAIEVAVFSTTNLSQCLGVQLLIVDGFVALCRGVYHACHLDHHIAARTRLVLQRRQRVGGGYERCIALQLLVGGLVHLALLHVCALYEVLQVGCLRLGNLVELVDVDEQKTTQRVQGFLLVGEVDTVNIELPQLLWQ